MKNTIFKVLCCGLLAVGCGGSDGSDSGGGAGASGTGNTAGSAGNGAAGKGGASSSGGAPSAGASNTAGSSNSGDCALAAALVSCYADTGGGVAVCTETALAGTPVDVIKSQCAGTAKENEHCPTNASLSGYCKGGVTTYYYAPPSNNVWASVGTSCEATSGTWCGQ